MQAKILRSEEGEKLSVLGIEHILYVTGPDSEGGVAFAELRIPPGAAIPAHVHTREDELFHVIAGAVAFRVGGREVTAGPGTTVFGPRGVPHAFGCGGPAAARLLLACTPAGLEGMLRELSRLPPGPPDLPRVAAIVGRYGISFV